MSMPAVTNPDAPLFGAAQTIDRQGLTAIIWFNFSCATLLLCLRLVVRWRVNRVFLPDDYWMIWAWLCLVTMAILQMQQMDSLWYITYSRAGRIEHTSEIGPQTIQLHRWSYPLTYLYWTAVWSVKASLLTTFFHFVAPIRNLRRFWYCVAVFVFLTYGAGWVVGSIPCNSLSDFFKADKCRSPRELWLARFSVFFATSCDVITDILVMALPIAVLPSLQLDTRKKIGLGVIFSLVFITICVSIVRMTQVVRGDTVDMVGLAIWSYVEAAVAVLVGSLLPLKALLTHGVMNAQSRDKEASQNYGSGDENDSRESYAPNSSSRDGVHRSEQTGGGIYVKRTCEMHVDGGSLPRETRCQMETS